MLNKMWLAHSPFFLVPFVTVSFHPLFAPFALADRPLPGSFGRGHHQHDFDELQRLHINRGTRTGSPSSRTSVLPLPELFLGRNTKFVQEQTEVIPQVKEEDTAPPVAAPPQPIDDWGREFSAYQFAPFSDSGNRFSSHHAVQKPGRNPYENNADRGTTPSLDEAVHYTSVQQYGVRGGPRTTKEGQPQQPGWRPHTGTTTTVEDHEVNAASSSSRPIITGGRTARRTTPQLNVNVNAAPPQNKHLPRANFMITPELMNAKSNSEILDAVKDFDIRVDPMATFSYDYTQTMFKNRLQLQQLFKRREKILKNSLLLKPDSRFLILVNDERINVPSLFLGLSGIDDSSTTGRMNANHNTQNRARFREMKRLNKVEWEEKVTPLQNGAVVPGRNIALVDQNVSELFPTLDSNNVDENSKNYHDEQMLQRVDKFETPSARRYFKKFMQKRSGSSSSGEDSGALEAADITASTSTVHNVIPQANNRRGGRVDDYMQNFPEHAPNERGRTLDYLRTMDYKQTSNQDYEEDLWSFFAGGGGAGSGSGSASTLENLDEEDFYENFFDKSKAERVIGKVLPGAAPGKMAFSGAVTDRSGVRGQQQQQVDPRQIAIQQTIDNVERQMVEKLFTNGFVFVGTSTSDNTNGASAPATARAASSSMNNKNPYCKSQRLEICYQCGEIQQKLALINHDREQKWQKAVNSYNGNNNNQQHKMNHAQTNHDGNFYGLRDLKFFVFDQTETRRTKLLVSKDMIKNGGEAVDRELAHFYTTNSGSSSSEANQLAFSKKELLLSFQPVFVTRNSENYPNTVSYRLNHIGFGTPPDTYFSTAKFRSYDSELTKRLVEMQSQMNLNGQHQTSKYGAPQKFEFEFEKGGGSGGVLAGYRLSFSSVFVNRETGMMMSPWVRDCFRANGPNQMQQSNLVFAGGHQHVLNIKNPASHVMHQPVISVTNQPSGGSSGAQTARVDYIAWREHHMGAAAAAGAQGAPVEQASMSSRYYTPLIQPDVAPTSALQQRHQKLELNPLNWRQVPVYVNVYDLDPPMNEDAAEKIKNLNFVFSNKMLKFGGVFHAGIEVHNREFSFGYTPHGTGVETHAPKKHHTHKYRESIFLGYTYLSVEELGNIVGAMERAWQGNSYDLLSRNCCTFSDEFAQVLLGMTSMAIPSWIHRFARWGNSLAHMFSGRDENDGAHVGNMGNVGRHATGPL
ncbi:unnamed protein product [Amoebophrya sp. A120]|nr:unnamed protein product [Amoebophrya sp. A120]|eukprot:GSA120T00007249001.1